MSVPQRRPAGTPAGGQFAARPTVEANGNLEGDLFADADVIYSYSRAQALEDGVLVDAGSAAKEAGFRWPVALTEEGEGRMPPASAVGLALS